MKGNQAAATREERGVRRRWNWVAKNPEEKLRNRAAICFLISGLRKG